MNPWITRHPHDRIRSAFSQDLVHFRKERGIRLQPAADRAVHMVMDPAVAPVGPGVWKMLFFESRGVGGDLMSAISEDGLDWARCGRPILARGAPGAEVAVMTPEPTTWPSGVNRLYVTGHGRDGRRRILSARGNDGLYEMEPGVRIDVERRWPDGAWSPCLVPLQDGRARLFFSGQDGDRFAVFSALTRDGVTFEVEGGERVSPGGRFDLARARHSRVVAVDGGYRMLYVGSNHSHWHSRILSAFSREGFVWEREPGIRVDIGGIWDTVGVFCPYPVRIGQGWRLYYGSFWGLHIMTRWWLRTAVAAWRAGRLMP